MLDLTSEQLSLLLGRVFGQLFSFREGISCAVVQPVVDFLEVLARALEEFDNVVKSLVVAFNVVVVFARVRAPEGYE